MLRARTLLIKLLLTVMMGENFDCFRNPNTPDIVLKFQISVYQKNLGVQ